VNWISQSVSRIHKHVSFAPPSSWRWHHRPTGVLTCKPSARLHGVTVRNTKVIHSTNRSDVLCFDKKKIGCPWWSHPSIQLTWLTDWLTHSMDWVLEKPPVAQLLKKFPAYHLTRRFITFFTTVLNWLLSWARSVHSIPPHPIYGEIIIRKIQCECDLRSQHALTKLSLQPDKYGGMKLIAILH
jgi:hypothetical protein